MTLAVRSLAIGRVRTTSASTDADLVACRDLLRRGSRSFWAASLMLPRRVRDPATALYAFCRVADDAVDDSGRPSDAVSDLSDRLARIYAGTPRPSPVDRAFAATVRRHGIPEALPGALIEGFRWDAEGRRYETPEDLDAYAVRVAGTVGMMMTVLMGRRSQAALARAADLGIAMQLTNIARDVGDDARAGRLYLPVRWLAEEGVDPDAFLARPVMTPGLERVVRRLLRRAEDHYARSRAGIALLPADCRPSIHAARLCYREIGRRLEADGIDPVRHRTVVPGRRKAALLTRAVGAAAFAGGHVGDPPSAAAADLVHLAAASVAPGSGERGMVRLIEILTALEHRDRAERSRLEPMR
jgi:phytoene synthase